MATVTPTGSGGLRFDFDRVETDVFTQLLDEFSKVLDDASNRSDPLIARLFPDAYPDSDDAAEFRAMAGGDLEDVKRQTVVAARDWLAQGAVPADAIWRWLALLTDLRMALAVRLGIDEAMMTAEPDPSDPRAPALSALHWLGWVQESSIEAISDDGD